MSSYFDALSREVAEAFEIEDDDQLVETVRNIEARLYRDVTYLTGDREFPDDLREKAMNVLAIQSIYCPGDFPEPQKAMRRILGRVGYSRAVEDMHELFHELARRRLPTRFCVALSDSPTHMALLRDEHDSEGAS